ncbi:MAG TPA: universal stress protein [Solirubrobacteraceae bacterium]|nr:universal stress protein [Solirubrobacteraceae bacterium]
MFENTLIGVDGGWGGRDAIALARSLSGADARLTLAYVHSGEVAEEMQDCEALLERERALAGVQAELRGVVAPSPGRGLHKQAEGQGADLLVVGSCSHGVFGRAMLGDDTRAALNGAPCAVAVAARGFAERPARIARVGVGYDGSPESAAALVCARELAAASGARVHAQEVIPPPPVSFAGLVTPAIGGYIEEMLREAQARMSKLADVEARAVYGLAGEELAAFGEKLDLLVVGSRGYGPVRRLVSGCTSDYLERHARCSLLVLARTAAAQVPDNARSGDMRVTRQAG